MPGFGGMPTRTEIINSGRETDCVRPLSRGEQEDLSNLRPLQWRNRMSKRGRRLICPHTAPGRDNVPR